MQGYEKNVRNKNARSHRRVFEGEPVLTDVTEAIVKIRQK